jgi:acyl-CoA synthetase (NDP forming)
VTDMADSSRPASHPLTELFNPKSIAIVGASDNSARSRTTYGHLQAGNFRHPVYLVNPRGGLVHGQESYTSLQAIGRPVDLACVLVGTGRVPGVLDDAHAAGVKNLIVIAAGFAENGPEGRTRQAELVAMAERYGQTILGPNNLGFINAWGDTFAWSSGMAPIRKGGVSVLSQSGALVVTLLSYCESHDIGMSHLITLGNEAQTTVDQAMCYLIDDPSTRVIAMYIESIRRPKAFLHACVAASEAGIPIVVYKSGRGELGARVAAAHTGGLVGDDALVSAIFKQYGIVRANTLEEWLMTAAVFDEYGALPGRRAAYMTASGALCGVFSDMADMVGLDVPAFDSKTAAGLAEILPPFATVQNPLDTTGFVMNDPSILPRARQLVAGDPNLDFFLTTYIYPRDAQSANNMLGGGIEDLVAKSPIPVIPVGALPSEPTPFSREYRRERKLPFQVESLSLGMPAIANTLWWAERQAEIKSAREMRTGASPMTVPSVPNAERIGMWSEHRASKLLRDSGIPVIPSMLCAGADDAVQAAETMGYPVVVKIASADIPHKSDVGGVALNLATGDDVRRATNAVLESARRQAAPGASIDGVLVSPMRSQGIEMLIGVIRDPIWGLTMAVGLGGIWVEVLSDTALRVLPVDRPEALLMLESLRGSALLRGARNQQAADLDALAEVIVQIGELATDLGTSLGELEINPLLVNGSQIEALDAIVRWWGTAANQ